MAATLVLNNPGKALVVGALKADLTHVFLARSADIFGLEALMTNDETLKGYTSDGSSRIKQPRIDETITEYRTYNDLDQLDESRITNFYLVNARSVNKLVLMNSERVVKGIITFNRITPTETKSLYIPQIKINVL